MIPEMNKKLEHGEHRGECTALAQAKGLSFLYSSIASWLLAYQNYCGLITCGSVLLCAHRTAWRKLTAPGKYVWVKTYIGKVCPAPQRCQSVAFTSTELTEEKEIIAEFKNLLPSINPDFQQCQRNISENGLPSFLNHALIKLCTDCVKQTLPEL